MSQKIHIFYTFLVEKMRSFNIPGLRLDWGITIIKSENFKMGQPCKVMQASSHVASNYEVNIFIEIFNLASTFLTL